MSEQTDTIEAVARAICEHVFGSPKSWKDFLPESRVMIAAHTKALFEGAGEVERLLRWWGEDGVTGDRRTLVQAAATIAALRAEIERAKEQGVRAGIEAALAAINDETPATSSDTWVEGWADCRNAIKAFDVAAIVKGME